MLLRCLLWVIKVFWGMNFQQISSHNMVNWGQELGAGTGG